MTILAVAVPAISQSDGVFHQAATWSRDGKRLAVTAQSNGHSAIYVGDGNGRRMKRITDPNADAMFASWSPDGTQLAVSALVDGNRDIYLMKPEPGAAMIRLTDDPATDTSPTWSPDGNTIAYASNRTGKFQIHSVGSDGSNPARVTSNEADDTNPAWSPVGSQIAFQSDRERALGDEIFVINADGSGERRLTNRAGSDSSPNWSGDGSRIVYSAQVEGDRRSLVSMNADGSDAQMLPVDGMFGSWAPNGERLAVIFGTYPATSLFVTRPDGTRRAAVELPRK
jgi:TolB protein